MIFCLMCFQSMCIFLTYERNKNQTIYFHRVFSSDIKKLLWWLQKVHILFTINNVVLYVSRISCIIYFCMIPNKF